MDISERSAVRLQAILAPLLAIALAGFTQDADRFRPDGSQRCYVTTGNTNCTTPTTTPEDREAERAERRRQEAIGRQYRDLQRRVEFMWRETWDSPLAQVRIDDGHAVLRYLREQLAIRDLPSTRRAIDQLEAWMTWNHGIIDDQNGNYRQAITELGEAISRRPELFDDDDRRYQSEVFQRYIQPSMRQVTFPTPEQWQWTQIRLFIFLPAAVSETVRHGFEAVRAGDLISARALFQDALNHDPGGGAGPTQFRNVMYRLLSSIDHPSAASTSPTGQRAAFADWSLPATPSVEALAQNASTMSNEQILEALNELVRLPARARFERARAQAEPTGVAASTVNTDTSVVDARDGQTVVQLNPDSQESIGVRTGPERQGCGAGANGALEQLQSGRTGRTSIGCLMENADDDTTWDGPPDTIASPEGVPVGIPTITQEQLALVRDDQRFKDADAALSLAHAEAVRAQARRAALAAQQAAAVDLQEQRRLQMELRDADQVAQQARAAQETAVRERTEVMELIEVEAAAEMENESPVPPSGGPSR